MFKVCDTDLLKYTNLFLADERRTGKESRNQRKNIETRQINILLEKILKLESGDLYRKFVSVGVQHVNHK